MPPQFRLLQISSSFWQAHALTVAAELNIADVIADKTLDIDTIATRIGTHGDGTYRLLRMLAVIGIFSECTPRHFANNKLSAPLRTDHPKSIRAMILMHHSPEMTRPWYAELKNGLMTGEIPFKRAHGEELFDYMDHHLEFDALFSHAMDSIEALAGSSFATDFDWSAFQRVIDIGGSKGSKAIAILKRHTHLKALVTDRASVIATARDYWLGRESDDILARLDFQSGDVFQSVPHAQGGDIYFMCTVLHGFSDEQCILALQNIAQAARASNPDTPLAIMETVVADIRADISAASFDMQMYIGTRGRERTRSEWNQLFEQSGWRLREIVDLHVPIKILVLDLQ